MGYARLEGVLTAVEVAILAKVKEINEAGRIPATLFRLLDLRGKKYAAATVHHHIATLLKWGYLRTEVEVGKRFFYLTEKSEDLLSGKGEVVVDGLGEVN